MPAREETYRSTRTLHIAFAITSVLMTISIVWMVLADHLRPWKAVQREFQEIETAKLRAQEQEKLEEQREKHQARIDELNAGIAEAERLGRERRREIADLEGRIKRIEGQFQQLDTQRRFKKAELDSFRSLYDGMIDRDERRQAARYVVETIEPTERQYAEISRKYDEVQRQLVEANLRKGLLTSRAVEVSSDPPPGSLAALAGFRSGDVMTVEQFETFRKALIDILTDRAPAGMVRVNVARGTAENVPVAFEARPIPEPSKPADDDAAWMAFALPVTPQTVEVLTRKREDITRDRDRIARTLKQKEAQYGEGEGIAGLWNRFNASLRDLPLLDMAAPPTKIQQISLPELTINYNFKDVPRYDRCTTCHQGIDRVGFETTADGKPMPAVYHSHPMLTTGATAISPATGKPVEAGLYLDANGPHPINAFGCTICHGGQGSGTSFTFASHEPNDEHQKHEWHEKYDWHKMHHWDEPMLPSRFLEASCLKCHHMVTDLKEHQAPKLLAGYERITKYGCTGCHTIGGEGSFGPDLTDNRPVGPNLAHIGAKTSRDWTLRWIKNPHAFRPDSRMPRFYGITNNDKAGDWPRNHAEIHAVTHYLFAHSTAPEFDEPPAENDPARGRQLFLEKGCMACHSAAPYQASDLPPSLARTADGQPAFNAAYRLDTEGLFPPDTFPETVRKYASADYGPNLSSVAAKFASKEQGYRWLANWIQKPESYHAQTLMPNLQLSAQDAADIAGWILSTRSDWGPGSEERFWPIEIEVPPVDSPEVTEGLDQLVRLYLGRSKTYQRRTILDRDIDGLVASMSTDEKLEYVGQRTIGRLGCFGCHNIPGYENEKPIGTPLNGWGFKSPTKLDYGHITEYLADNPPDEADDRDGTPEYYQEQLADHTRSGFLFQKLHRPRSYDYKKDRDDLKPWDDRLRMPQFSWSDDPAAIEEVMTFVLGLTGEKIPARYLPHEKYTPAQLALAKGERLVDRYNCRGCHVMAMPRFEIAGDADLNKVFRSDDPADEQAFQTNVMLAYENRSKDHLALYPGLTYEAGQPPELQAHDGKPVVLEGMPVGLDVQEDEQGRPDRTLYLQLWRPATIRGFRFQVGDTVTLNPDRVSERPAEGGDFAWLYSTWSAEQTGEPLGPIWNKLPPPLIREGVKVQTPWLTQFLQDPYKIRPAAMLRMPRFHYGAHAKFSTFGKGESARPALTETRDLANYFAARDGAIFPYQEIPQREQAYLAAREGMFGDTSAIPAEGATPAGVPRSPYLDAGWNLITKNQCIQCHAIGALRPTGEEKSHGPNLRQVAGRLRPEYMMEWVANPVRLVPYTAMPQVFPPAGAQAANPVVGVPPALEGKPVEQVRTVVDTLLNYVAAVEQQLAAAAPPVTPPDPAAAAPGAVDAAAAAPGGAP
jgi:cbb3-type cytochrome oxidase cytochrome c subunit